MMSEWLEKELDSICRVEYGTRVVNKRNGGTIYPVYGGGGATFFMDTYNRENCFIVSRFAMSKECTRFVQGKFFLNDSGLSVTPIDTKSINQQYLNYQLYFLNDDIYSLARGAAQKNLDVPTFKKLKLKYPNTIDEQQQLVDILDKAFAAIDKAKANCEQNLKNAREVFESYVANLFEVKFNDSNLKTLGDVCDEIFAGGDAPKNNFSLSTNEKYHIPIYANAVKAKGLYGYTDFYRVSKPCVTIAARGSGTGHTELRNEKFLPIVRLIVCIADGSQVLVEFLKYTIDNLVIQRSGSAIPQLTVPMIKNYVIPVPPLTEQTFFLEKAKRFKNNVEKLEALYTQKLNNLEELKKSLLQKAFSGKLTAKEVQEI